MLDDFRDEANACPYFEDEISEAFSVKNPDKYAALIKELKNFEGEKVNDS